LIGVGQFDYKFAYNNNLTGVLLRSTGVCHDIRLNLQETYANYFYLNFKSFTGLNGDCYDRYLLRIAEILESLNIANQTLSKLKNKNNETKLKYFTNNKDKVYQNMESLINHFKYWSEGIILTANTISSSVESPKGEFSVTIDSNNTNKPNRVKVRSPAYFNMQVVKHLARGHLLADLITLIGTIDVVFGEVDR
jgi:NADH-quinone oxidoreductase subunit D